jgi:hypothetical protein
MTSKSWSLCLEGKHMQPMNRLLFAAAVIMIEAKGYQRTDANFDL